MYKYLFNFLIKKLIDNTKHFLRKILSALIFAVCVITTNFFSHYIIF